MAADFVEAIGIVIAIAFSSLAININLDSGRTCISIKDSYTKAGVSVETSFNTFFNDFCGTSRLIRSETSSTIAGISSETGGTFFTVARNFFAAGTGLT